MLIKKDGKSFFHVIHLGRRFMVYKTKVLIVKNGVASNPEMWRLVSGVSLFLGYFKTRKLALDFIEEIKPTN